VRTSFWNRYASSFEPFAEPKPDSALPPRSSRIFLIPAAARVSASSQGASRNTLSRWENALSKSASLYGATSRRISGFVRRSGDIA
jgi:hypothetical protein